MTVQGTRQKVMKERRTMRGKVIARVVKENSRRSSLRQALQALVLKGQVVMPAQEINRVVPAPVKLPGKAVSEMVLEDRR